MTKLYPSSHAATPSRRDFLKLAACSSAAFACRQPLLADDASDAAGRSSDLIELSDHLFVVPGPVHTGVIRDGERALLIDCGSGRIEASLRQRGIERIEQILFTHHHRDQAWPAYSLAAGGAKIHVPEAAKDSFVNPSDYWDDDNHIWRVYRSFRPDPRSLTESLAVDGTLADGQTLSFGPAKIRAFSTPGHTNGSLSFLVEVDGRRVVFSGDCIYDEGQLWDVYSLQRGFSKNDRSIGAYHGFMGDQERLVESLQTIKDCDADLLVPSHGRLMHDPAKAIDVLVERLSACYENYVSISALRHYFPELFDEYAGRPGQMPIRPGLEVPACLRHFGTTWMLISATGAALVMDVGSTGLVSRFQQMLDRGEIKSIDALWVTHYHNDHTDGIPLFQQQFDCPCYTEQRLAQVLTEPRAWRLPCLGSEAIRVDHALEDGHSWTWREFKLTSFFYPGQTLYHAALLVEHEDLRMLFVGDAHTMSGNDDYCAHNRNLLGREVGYQYCLSLVERLQPTHMFNCHVNDAFTFTPEEIRMMREKLDEREKLFGQLVPWDHANYGLDPSWVRCYPYTQVARPGAVIQVDVVITNHSDRAHAARCRAVLPTAWAEGEASEAGHEIAAKAERPLSLTITVPAQAAPGRYVIPIDLDYGDWQLPRFSEAIVDVT